MKTLVCLEPRKLVLAEREVQPTPEGWVPLKIARVGICGTDYHIYEGTQPFLEYPRVMGHEVSAWVAEEYLGDDFEPGELVVINPYLSCGECHACKMDKANCCERIQVLGVHRDGAMVERIAVPPQNLIKVGVLTPDQAAMVEFLAIGRHAVARAQVAPQTKVLVIGGGPIGLACALFARIEGGDVAVIETSAAKRRLLSEKFGFQTHDTADAAAMDGSATYLFDATGNLNAMNGALRFLAHGGTYTLVSVVKGDLTFPDPEFHKRETTLLSSRNALDTDFKFVVDAIASGKIDTSLLFTHRTTFEDAAHDIETWSGARETVIKAILEVA